MMWKVKAAICALMPVCAHATTLVALWTPERVLIAADSRVILNDSESGDACKIGRSGTTWFAVAGLVSDSGTGYAVGDILRTSMEAGGELTSKVDRFITAVQPGLSDAVAALRRDDPTQYASFTGGRPILQTILADTAQGKPVVVTVSFTIDPAGAVSPRASLIDGSDLSGPRIIYAGQQDRIRTWLRSHRDWFEGNKEELVRNLVQLEVDAKTPWVGGPVDVLEISGTGSRWLQCKSSCRN